MHRANQPADRGASPDDGSASSTDPPAADAPALGAIFPIGIAIVDGAGRLLSASPAAQLLLGVRAPSGVDQLSDEITGIAQADFVQRIGAVLQHDAPQSLPPLELHSARGMRSLRLSLTPLQRSGQASRTAALLIEDMTDQVPAAHSAGRRAEPEPEAAAELARFERLKEEFVSIASHELRTPLTTIIGYLYMLAQQAHRQPSLSEAEHESRLSRIIVILQSQLSRLTRLVDDLVDVGRLQSGTLPLRLADIDLADTVQQAVAEVMNVVSQPPIELHHASGQRFPISGDSERLAQVLVDLLQNAAAYAGTSPHIAVWLRRIDHQGAPSTVEVAIEDHGPGITLTDQVAIFRPFYQIDPRNRRARTGLGLGLYLARQLVEQHGGALTLDSEPGRGSIFKLALPLAEPVA